MKIYFGGNYEKNNSSLYIPTSKCLIGDPYNLLKLLCISELTILQILYCASLISFLWMYGQRKQVVKVNMKTRMKWLGIGFVSLLIISLCFSLIHAQGSTNQANLIGLQHQVPLVFIFIVLNQCEYG